MCGRGLCVCPAYDVLVPRWTPLHAAAAGGHLAIVQSLCACGVRRGVRTRPRSTRGAAARPGTAARGGGARPPLPGGGGDEEQTGETAADVAASRRFPLVANYLTTGEPSISVDDVFAAVKRGDDE